MSLATKGGYFAKLGILSDAENEKDEFMENQGEINSLSEPHLLESNSSAEYLSNEASQSDRKNFYLKDDIKDEKEILIKVIIFLSKKAKRIIGN